MRRRTCSQGGLHLINTPYARPAGPQQGLTRPLPSAFGGRTTQKIISRAHCKEQIEQFNSIKYLPSLASGAPRTARGSGLFLLSISGWPVAAVLLKHHPGVRCCGRRGGLFC